MVGSAKIKIMTKKITLVLVLFAFVAVKAQAQSVFSSITSAVSSAVSSVTGGSDVTTSSIAGTWSYSSPAVELDSDNALTSAAGALATSQLESKMSEYCTKAGIKAGTFSFTFGSDSSFSCTVVGKTVSGTYTIDSSAGTVTLKFSASSYNLASMTAYTTLSGSTLSLLFQADKLLDFISKVASVSDDSTLQTVQSLVSNYDGLKLGFELTK